MIFPHADRVIYDRNPLDKVICQLRFPPILRIDSEVPSAFQENIRDIFPLYNEKSNMHQEIVMSINKGFPLQLNQLEKPSVSKNHEFVSEDGKWKINLSKTFISILTTDYKRWEDFMEKFRPSIDALLNIYKPPFFNRIGLRYIDIFERSKYNLGVTNWVELLNPKIIGLLSSDIEQYIKHCENIYEIRLDDNNNMLRINTSFVKNIKTDEQGYMVDSDLYHYSRINTDMSKDILNILHENATRFVRWLITDKLHNAMDPKPI